MERTQVQMCKEEYDGMVILGTDDKRNIEKTMQRCSTYKEEVRHKKEDDG